MSALAVPHVTPEEYLKLDRAAEFRSEYYDGQMYAMSGGLLPHALIGTQLASALVVVLQGKKCRAAGSDLRVGVTAKGPFYYPDVTVYCGEAQLTEDYRDTLLNPTVIFEVLSTSTEAFDRGKKFAAYRRIESLHEYVLVSQTEPSIEVFVKGPDSQWTLTESTGLEANCTLKSIGCEIVLADVYRDVPLGGGTE